MMAANERFVIAAEQKLQELDVSHLCSSVEGMKAATADLAHYFGQTQSLTDVTEIIAALKKLKQAVVTSRYIVIGSSGKK
jgi:hypothetical protein